MGFAKRVERRARILVAGRVMGAGAAQVVSNGRERRTRVGCPSLVREMKPVSSEGDEEERVLRKLGLFWDPAV